MDHMGGKFLQNMFLFLNRELRNANRIYRKLSKFAVNSSFPLTENQNQSRVNCLLNTILYIPKSRSHSAPQRSATPISSIQQIICVWFDKILPIISFIRLKKLSRNIQRTEKVICSIIKREKVSLVRDLSQVST